MRTGFWMHHRAAQMLCLFGVSALTGGCGGTSTQWGNTAPPMTAPALKSRSSAPALGGGTAASRATEAALPALEVVSPPKGVFTDEPYLQLGDAATPMQDGKESLTICWQSPGGAKSGWTVEARPSSGGTWQKATASVSARPLNLPGQGGETLYRCPIDGLAPGKLFDYRVLQSGKAVFASRARARRAVSEPYRFIVVGDCSERENDQKKIVYQASLQKPDFAFMTGNIVYNRGRASEYQSRYFPIYNADKAAADSGAPLLRSTLFLACAGKDDLTDNDLSKWSDGLAYFYYWDVPSNGPSLADGDKNTAKTTGDAADAARALRTAAGDAYPRAANYSFDYAGAHWTVLDANSYMNWDDKTLRMWLEKDLAGAQKSSWRFVAFHEPPFASSQENKDEARMRAICDLLQKYHVDVVWSGHARNYQRTYPLTFARSGDRQGAGMIAGDWTMDKTYDGDKKTDATAPIYVVAGGGGPALPHNSAEKEPEKMQPFSAKEIMDHSFTVVDIDGPKMTVRQLSDEGKELDHWTLTHKAR